MNAESLPILFRSLELSAFAREADSALARAEAENWGYRRLLQHLAEAEVQDRRARKIERLLRYSGLPPSETFARFDEAIPHPTAGAATVRFPGRSRPPRHRARPTSGRPPKAICWPPARATNSPADQIIANECQSRTKSALC